MRRWRRSLLLVALASGVAAAQTPPAPSKAPEVEEPAPPPPPPPNAKKEGEYGGVAPGAPKAPSTRPAKSKRPPPKGTLSWIGFEAKDGGAQLFFQSPGPFQVTQRLQGSTLIVHLSLTRMGANTWRQIDTRFFDNPLAYVVARAVGARRATKTTPAQTRGIDVRITFKNPKDAREGSVRSATEADGMQYVYLAFPEGTAEPGKAAPSATEPER